jgi:hypothetical protein
MDARSETRRPGIARPRISILWRAVAASITALLLLYCSAQAYLKFEANRAQRMLKELASIEVGESESTLADISRNFGRQSDNNASPEVARHRSLGVDPWRLKAGIFKSDWLDGTARRSIGEYGVLRKFRRRIGLRMWTVLGNVTIEAGKVREVDTDVLVEGENEWLKADWSYAKDFDPRLHLERDYPAASSSSNLKFYSKWTHLHWDDETGEGTLNYVTLAATPEEKDASKSINGNCLTSWRGCRSLCELMPNAARYRHLHNYPEWGWSSGSWGSQDHSCQ